MIPHEKALVQRLEKEPFALVGVNTDGDKAQYRDKAREMGVTWRSSWQGSTSGPWPTQWGITSFPTVFVLDAQGVLRGVNVREEALDKLVDDLLRELHASEKPAPR